MPDDRKPKKLVACPRCTTVSGFRNWCYLCDQDRLVTPELAAAYCLLKQSNTLIEGEKIGFHILQLRVDVGDLKPTPEEYANYRQWFFAGSSYLRQMKGWHEKTS